MPIFAFMKLKHKHLVKVESEFSPNIVTIKEVIDETGISRQGLEQSPLTFGVVLKLDKKVIIKDEKYDAFMDKRKNK